MSKEERTSLQSELAAALAAGKSCAEWASAHGVSERTAQRWASDSEVRAEVDAYRRGNLDEAVGRMSLRAVWATDQIAKLAEEARSESVRLAALRSMLSDMMAVTDFAGLEGRIANSRSKTVYGTKKTRVLRIEARRRPAAAVVVDRSRWDWYAESCSCGLPPGECRAHPRGRPSQRPPGGDWRVWGYVAGRGAGKTRAGACWVQHRAQAGVMKLGCLIAPTMADVRDVMVEGPSGLLAVAPPWCQPRFEPSKRRVTWPDGARAICLSGEEPERARGLNVDTLWADELACWQRAESTWDMAMLALRAGTNPQALITTTPRRVAILRRILAEATTVQTTDTTFANQAHLPREFVAQIVGLYENTRLGRQEIYAEFLETSEGVWFTRFDPARHVSVQAEYDPMYHVRCAIDAGTSRHTAAVFFQVRHHNGQAPPRVTVFGDYHALDVVSRTNAVAIKELAGRLPCYGKIDLVRLDPAAAARSSLGPVAYSEYEQVFGSRLVARWPCHLVLDGLETLDLLLESGNLLIHPRCTRLRDAFGTYSRQRRGGEWIDYPADSHPEEDLIDALRGGVRDAFPQGLAPGPKVHQVRASGIM